MKRTEVLIVGGGPAGASCAWALRRQGVPCLILDRVPFPRVKLCAGWIQPEVMQRLDFTPETYPGGLLRFDVLKVAVRGIRLPIPTRQYAIRRVEFDHWLLRRAGVPVEVHHVREIEHTADGYVVDGAYSGRYLVGAGGTHDPVYRTFFQKTSPRASESLIVTQELEFPYDYADGHCYLWFMEHRLPGYSWYVPKAGGYLNVGVGGKAEKLRERDDSIKRHWDLLIRKLRRSGLLDDRPLRPKGHSYYLRRDDGDRVQIDNALLVGDAAGLATVDMGEGIAPAVESGLRAAAAIVSGNAYTVAGIRKRSMHLSGLRF
jgi:flavin-dependent dehydrogenase